ncbi:hypothetical protein OOT46_19460 [Aquabacterium sp. A7-Y]|uniref:hypothetical protein n=1 Tax=Aquabacterium sp. A7-Y TaxID=1349605 RepID=UPI00223D872C|nr:hypothetical protein [Aquabacterium sp. A7-Y]MCW7540019.1 hypothetical protein [Aquabacterium sp. A7-Y]
MALSTSREPLFIRWLNKQTGRTDVVGDLAAFAREDEWASQIDDSLQHWICHLQLCRAPQRLQEAARLAWSEYSRRAAGQPVALRVG